MAGKSLKYTTIAGNSPKGANVAGAGVDNYNKIVGGQPGSKSGQKMGKPAAKNTGKSAGKKSSYKGGY